MEERRRLSQHPKLSGIYCRKEQPVSGSNRVKLINPVDETDEVILSFLGFSVSPAAGTVCSWEWFTGFAGYRSSNPRARKHVSRLGSQARVQVLPEEVVRKIYTGRA